MDRKRKIGFIVFMVVFISAAVVLPLLDQKPVAKGSKQETILSDGRKIELHAVTYGTNHSVTIERKSKNPLTRLLHTMFGGRTQRYSQTERHEVLIPWLIIPPAPVSRSSPNFSSFGIVSDTGVNLTTGGRSTTSLDDGTKLVRTALRAFPRRDEFFTLTGAVDRLPFSIRIKNPVFGRKFPTWTPHNLPATNTAGDYQFVLASPQLRGNQRGGYLSAKLEIFHRDQPVDEWFQTSFDLSDPTGNRAFSLSTNETIWKTHFQMWKTFIGPWNTNHYREFLLPELPAAAGHQIIPINDLINGFRVDRLWLGGPGSYRIENGKMTKAAKLAPGAGEKWSRRSGSHGSSMDWDRHDHWLLLEMIRWPRDNQRLSVFVRDSKGQDLTVESRGWSGGSGVSTAAFLLKPPRAALLAARRDPTKSTKLKDLVTPPFTLRLGIQTNMQTEFILDITKLKRDP